MHVTYKPEGTAPQEWDFTLGRVRASEAELMENRFGDSWEAFAQGVRRGNMRARRVLLWHLIRRDGHVLRYEDTPDFFADELVVEFSSDELAELRAAIEKNPALSVDEREAALASVDREMAEAMEREGKAATAAVASSPMPSTDGGSSSPLSSTFLPGESAI